MDKIFNVENAVAIISCGAVEAETISKTRASLKSHTSKGNFLIMLLSIFFIGFILSGCQKKPVNQLFDELMNQQDVRQSEKIAIAIAKRGEDAVPFLIGKMQSSSQEVRFTAADILVLMKKYRPNAVKDLTSAIDESNLSRIAENYPFYIRLGIAGTEQIILNALDNHFSKDMCVDYINCGNSTIENGASNIARRRGYEVYRTRGHHSGPKWGQGN